VPIEIAPNRVEFSELSGGFSPDTPEASIPTNASPDMLNLLLEHGGMSPEVRKGYERLSAGRSSLTTHSLRNLFYYETINDGTRSRYLIAIMSDGTSSANNVQVWAYDLLNDTFTRVDNVGRTWTNPNSPHWSVVVSGTYYGGVRGDAIYRWHPIDGWSDDPTANDTLDTWVDAINDGVDTASEKGRDYAFKERQKVAFDGEEYSALRDIRYDKWASDEQYHVGDRVSRKHVWASTSSYWKSFVCIVSHKASTEFNAPGTGTGWRTFWKKVRLDNILDEDGELNDPWTLAGNGVKSSVGIFYGDRMMVRRDNENERSFIQYSQPLTTSTQDKHQKIADIVWDPKAWAAVDTIDHEGGGFFPVSPGRGDAIRDVYAMGNYLVIAKRWSTHVLSGRAEANWSQRPVGPLGVVALHNMAELDGIVYGLSHTGTLWMTDGTNQKEVPGAEKAREFIKERIDRLLQTTPEDDDERWMPTVWAYDRRVWISLPDTFSAGSPDDITMVYDPLTESWWKLALPILAATTGAADRAERMWFSTPRRSGNATIFQYADDPGDLVYTDDDPLGGATPLTTAIPWRYRTGWVQFGSARNERRIRRAWALVKTAVTVTIKGYRNFNTTNVYSVSRSASADGTSHVEGKTLGRAVRATALEVSGTAATGGPAIVGFGMDTEPIRTRFHRN
jgi:hypothetical protein